jgi:hypothetical protein
MYHANAALNITTDLLVAALPIRQLWKLQIAMRQKIALLLILTLGWLYVPPLSPYVPHSNCTRSVVIISIIRLYFLVLVAKHPTDQTWYSGPAAYWSAMEVNLAIVCASTPALRPLVVKLIPMFGSRFGSKRSAGSDSDGFTRLQAKPSIGEDIRLEHGIREIPQVYEKRGQESWKEIHVMREFEQRSMNGRGSGDSTTDLCGRVPRTTGRR